MSAVVSTQPPTVQRPAPSPLRRWGARNALEALWRSTGSLIVLLILWEIAGHLFQLVWLPPVSSVIGRLFGMFASGELTQHLLSSLMSLGIGFAISLVFGLVIGFLMGLFPSVYTALDVYVNAMLFTPSLIFAPILFAIFGLSDATRIGVVVLYAMFVIIINTATAVRNVDSPLLDMTASFGGTRWQAIRHVVIPASGPLVVAGIRLGAGRAVKGMINGEIFIALIGIGGLAASYGRSYDFTAVWAISLFIMVLAVVINQAVSALEKKATSWVD